MSWTKVQGTGADNLNSSASPTIAFANTITSGSIVAGFVFYTNTSTSNQITSVTDDKSNTYSLIQFVTANPSQVYNVGMYWSNGRLTNAPKTLTINLTAAQGNVWTEWGEFTPPAGTLSTDGSTGQYNASPTSNFNSGNITTTQNGDLILGYAAINGSANPGSGFTILNANNATTGSDTTTPNHNISEYQNQTSAGTISATFQNGPLADDICCVFALSAVSGTTIVEAEQFIGRFNTTTFQRAKNSWSVDGLPFVVDTVGANPHFIGRFTQPVFNRIAIENNLSEVSTFETNTHFIGRFSTPVFQRAINSWDIQGLSFVVDTVGANPHFVGKFSAPAFNRIPITGYNSDVFIAPTLFDTPVNFIAQFRTEQYKRIGYSSYDNQGIPQAFATEIPVNFIAKYQPAKFYNSVSYFHTDTGVPFVPPAVQVTAGRQITPEEALAELNTWWKKITVGVDGQLSHELSQYGRQGGIARANSLSKNQRTAIATLGANTRWKK